MKNKERIVWIVALACIMACISWSGGPATSVAYADGNGGGPRPLASPSDSGDSVIALPSQIDEPVPIMNIIIEFVAEMF